MKKYFYKPYFFFIILIVFEIVARGWILIYSRGFSASFEIPFYDISGPITSEINRLQTEAITMILLNLIERALVVLAILWFLIRIFFKELQKNRF